MNSKWILAVPIAAILVVSAIGIGFAYSASTQNSDNSLDVQYLTIRTSSNAAGTDPSYSGMVNFTDEQGGLGSVIWDSKTNLYQVGDETEATEHIVWTLATGDNENVVDDTTTSVTHRTLVLKETISELGDHQAALLIGTLYFTLGDDNDTFNTTYDLFLTHEVLADTDAPAKVYALMYTSADQSTYTVTAQWVDISAAAAAETPQTLSAAAGNTAQYLKMELYAVYDGYYAQDSSADPIAINGIVTDADEDLNYSFSDIDLTFKATPHPTA